MLITAHLMGGLGNQLFQIFATMTYSFTNKIPFTFPRLKDSREAQYRQTVYWDSFLSNLSKFTYNGSKQLPIYKERKFTYTELPTKNMPQQGFKLFGYFQNEKYFKSQYENIIRFIGLRKQQEKITVPENCISLHFRIGDYVLPQFKDAHPLMPIEYYINALNHIMGGIGGLSPPRSVLYFCQKQDNNTVEKKINILKEKFPKLTFISAGDEKEDWEQMLMMSCCEHNIIANSSFSWWAAYFNGNKNKIVCYPNVWFGPKLADKDTSDLCPNSWISI
jgi:hypothetical protein